MTNVYTLCRTSMFTTSLGACSLYICCYLYNLLSVYCFRCTHLIVDHQVYTGAIVQVGVERMDKDSKYVLFPDDDVPVSIGALSVEMEKYPVVWLCKHTCFDLPKLVSYGLIFRLLYWP